MVGAHFQATRSTANSNRNGNGAVLGAVPTGRSAAFIFVVISDIEPLRESLAELNRALTQLSRILELSGNPIAVLENVEEARDIAVQPGAVWEIPEQARAYLLDLLQGGGVRLHVEYADLVYPPCTTCRRRRASPSGTVAATAPAARCSWSWTRCCARLRASG